MLCVSDGTGGEKRMKSLLRFVFWLEELFKQFELKKLGQKEVVRV